MTLFVKTTATVDGDTGTVVGREEVVVSSVSMGGDTAEEYTVCDAGYVMCAREVNQDC